MLYIGCVNASQEKPSVDVQGDPSPCAKPPVDFKSKVPLLPDHSRAGQATRELYC